MAKETTKAQPQKQVPQQSKSVFPLDKINLVLIAICIVLIAVGFALMGGSANEGSTFNYDIFSTRLAAPWWVPPLPCWALCS